MTMPKFEQSVIDPIREILSYNEATGEFTWKRGKWGVTCGSVSGHLNSNGYIYITVLGRRYLAHRLAWAYVHGVFPPEEIDHINRNRRDNRLDNLRLATRAMNAHNRSVQLNSKTGIPGVSWHEASRKFRARVSTGGLEIYVGVFNAIESAASAMANAIAATPSPEGDVK